MRNKIADMQYDARDMEITGIFALQCFLLNYTSDMSCVSLIRAINAAVDKRISEIGKSFVPTFFFNKNAEDTELYIYLREQQFQEIEAFDKITIGINPTTGSLQIIERCWTTVPKTLKVLNLLDLKAYIHNLTNFVKEKERQTLVGAYSLCKKIAFNNKVDNRVMFLTTTEEKAIKIVAIDLHEKEIMSINLAVTN
jgi:hypothetical protein